MSRKKPKPKPKPSPEYFDTSEPTVAVDPGPEQEPEPGLPDVSDEPGLGTPPKAVEVAQEPVAVSEEVLIEQAVACVKKCDNLWGGDAHLVMIRIPGNLTDAVFDEYAAFPASGRSRVAGETEVWF